MKHPTYVIEVDESDRVALHALDEQEMWDAVDYE
jgi:hypothetical protein